MTSSASIAKSTDESGRQSIQDRKTETRILPYYCSWYRTIFTCEKPVTGSENEERVPGQVPG